MKWLLAIFLFTACASTAPIHSGSSLNALSDLNKKINEREKVSGFGTLSLSMKDRKGTGQSVLQILWPDKFRLEFQDPVGGRVLLLQFNQKYVLVDEPKAPEALLINIESDKGLERAKELFQLGKLGPNTFEIWLRLFLARPDLEDFTVDPQDQKHLLKYRGAEIAEEIRLNSDGEIKDWYLAAPDAQSEAISVSYETYQRRASSVFPIYIRLKIESGARIGSTITWRWQDWMANPGREALLELPPKNFSSDRKIKKLP